MAEIEIRCEVSLTEPIVLATQASTEYVPLQWTLSTGSRAVVRMKVAEEAAKAYFAEHSSTRNDFVNTRVESLDILLAVPNLPDKEISRLLGKESAEPTFHAHIETAAGPLDFDYQCAEQLGRRIVDDIVETANTVLRFIRINYGQHWLSLVRSDEEGLQNFLIRVNAKWSPQGTSWRPLVVEPPNVNIRGVFVGGAGEYLQICDWQEIQSALARGDGPSEPYALISDAKERFAHGEKHFAILHLNSALESAVCQFIERQLGPKIPAASLKRILKDSYDELLNRWVLPLSDNLNLQLRNREWQSIRKIQELRREAGHPTVSTGVAALSDADWYRLVRDATAAIVTLTGTSAPKSPHPLVFEMQIGTD